MAGDVTAILKRQAPGGGLADWALTGDVEVVR